jgi:hypothetical protein
MKGYKTSNDYDLFRRLLDSGLQVPCFMYGTLYIASLDAGSWYRLGTCSLSRFNSTPFELFCQQNKVAFIPPTEISEIDV